MSDVRVIDLIANQIRINRRGATSAAVWAENILTALQSSGYRVVEDMCQAKDGDSGADGIAPADAEALQSSDSAEANTIWACEPGGRPERRTPMTNEEWARAIVYSVFDVRGKPQHIGLDGGICLDYLISASQKAISEALAAAFEDGKIAEREEWGKLMALQRKARASHASVSEWQLVDTVPQAIKDEGEDVLICSDLESDDEPVWAVTMASWCTDCWRDTMGIALGECEVPKYWMPMPKPPSQSKIEEQAKRSDEVEPENSSASLTQKTQPNT